LFGDAPDPFVARVIDGKGKGKVGEAPEQAE
jgi:hypothetical protein